MSNGDALRRARAEISRHHGNSEFAAVAENESLQEMLVQIQELKDEMNEAKKAAMIEAAKPYLEAIKNLEENYALYLKLASG
jgi:DNA primase